MPYFSHSVPCFVSIILLLAACHFNGGARPHLHRTISPGQDDDYLALLQTSANTVSDGLRRGSSRHSGPPNATEPLDIILQYGSDMNISLTTPIEDLEPCWHTPGGGCAGGWNKDRGMVYHAPAPPHHFPVGSGCQWKSPKRIAMVHVGKCAGESLQEMLNQAPVNFTHVHEEWHVAWFDPDDYDLFVVSVRDPLSRTVSAFNFGRGMARSPVANEMYQCFEEKASNDSMGVMNTWAEALDEPRSKCGRLARRCLHSQPAMCSHLATGIAWYALTGHHRWSRSLITAVGSSNGTKHVLLVPAENFSAGASAMFDWLCVPPESRPEDSHVQPPGSFGNDTFLSPKGRKNLERHMADEYYALHELSRLAVSW